MSLDFEEKLLAQPQVFEASIKDKACQAVTHLRVGNFAGEATTLDRLKRIKIVTLNAVDARGKVGTAALKRTYWQF